MANVFTLTFTTDDLDCFFHDMFEEELANRRGETPDRNWDDFLALLLEDAADTSKTGRTDFERYFMDTFPVSYMCMQDHLDGAVEGYINMKAREYFEEG